MQVKYSQPDFYRFSEDSIKLVNVALTLNLINPKVLDLCAGCGVIGIEYAKKNKVKTLDFIEVQSEFNIHLKKNINTFIPNIDSYILNNSFQNTLKDNPSKKYDLILCNPPYFQESSSRVSPSENKRLCRTFGDNGPTEIFHFIFSSLSEKGSGIIIFPKTHFWLKAIEESLDIIAQQIKSFDDLVVYLIKRDVNK